MRSYSYCQKSWKNAKQSTTKMGSSIKSPRYVGFGTKPRHGRERSKIQPAPEVVQSYAKRHTAWARARQDQCQERTLLGVVCRPWLMVKHKWNCPAFTLLDELVGRQENHGVGVALGSPRQNMRGCNISQIDECPQCLLRISAWLVMPTMWWNRVTPATIALRVRWHERALWHLCSLEWGTEAVLTMDSLSPNIKDG